LRDDLETVFELRCTNFKAIMCEEHAQKLVLKKSPPQWTGRYFSAFSLTVYRHQTI